jgi:hypothetical protein
MLALVRGRQDTAGAGHHALAVHNLAGRGGRRARHRDPLGGGQGQAGGSGGLIARGSSKNGSKLGGGGV